MDGVKILITFWEFDRYHDVLRIPLRER